MTTLQILNLKNATFKTLVNQIEGARERNPKDRINTKDVLLTLASRYDTYSKEEKEALALVIGGNPQ